MQLHCHEQWLAEDVRIRGCGELKLHHLYRAMDFLHAHKAALEEGLYYRVADLLNLDVELVFYDTTSLHEIADEDAEAGGAPLRKRGHSKNGRGDAPQVLVGLAVTREGFPVRHWVFPGNTVDVSTVAKVKRDLKGWRLNRCVFVGDAGMVSAENLKALARGGGRYIVCMPVHRGGEADEVIGRRGRYREVAENLHVKEVVVGEGERRRATRCASIRARPSASAGTGRRSWRIWRPNWLRCARATAATASGPASCAPAAATGVTCG